MKRSIARIQPSVGTSPSARHRSQSRLALQGAFSPHGSPETGRSVAPPASATPASGSSIRLVSTTASPTRPSTTAGTRAAKVTARASTPRSTLMTRRDHRRTIAQGRLSSLPPSADDVTRFGLDFVLYLFSVLTSVHPDPRQDRGGFHDRSDRSRHDPPAARRIRLRAAVPLDLSSEAARRRMEDPAYRVEVERRRGRGAVSNAGGRFEPMHREAFDDGWDLDEEASPLPTEIIIEKPRTIIARNDSPTSRSTAPSTPIAAASTVAPTASHGRPMRTRASPQGLDFETKIFAKANAAELLERSSARPATSRGPSRSGPIPIPTSRSNGTSASPVRSWKCSTVRTIRSASSRSRPSSRATSTSSLRWPTGSSPRWPSRSRPSTPSSIAPWSPRGEPRQASRHHSQALRGRHPGRSSSRRSSRPSTSTRSRRS